MKHVTNIFPITNLHEISAEYRLFDIKGLRRSHKEYQSHRQWLIDKFSKTLKHPVTIIEVENEPKLVVKNDPAVLAKIKNEYDFTRLYLHLSLTEKVFAIDFVNPTEEVKKICIRFLQFDLNGELKKNPSLWQPYTGGPFFLKDHEVSDGIAIYRGFTFRVIELPQGGFGIIIDATRKFASATPVDHYITKQEFLKRFRKSKESKSFIYRYSDWYEIKPTECDDFNVTQFKIQGVSLIDHIRNAIQKPHSSELANLPNDSSVLTYYTNNGETRGAPAGMLYQVFDFQDTHNPEINRRAIISPAKRFTEIREYKWNYFFKLRFGSTQLKLADKALEPPLQLLGFPGFELGNNYRINPAEFNDAKNLARHRLNKLLDPTVGFYTRSPLPNQVVVLPRSVSDTSGEIFIERLKDTMGQLYPSDTYAPDMVVYEDKFRQGTDYVAVGKHIVNAVKAKYSKANQLYGIVMIPRLDKKAKREHDKLSALVIRELKLLNINCSIIHTDVVRTCFESKRDKNGNTVYQVRYDKPGKFDGYIKNVAINKILLNCNKWPFVLNDPLLADITIGIDVKHHTAGFTIVDKYCKNIRTELDETSNKERLSSEQLKARLYNIIKTEFEIDRNSSFKHIVIHRDGRLFDVELEGLLAGLQKLKDEMIVRPDAELHIIEIPKTSFLSVRIFGLKWNEKEQKTFAENPPIGFHYFLKDEVFLCTTGKEFHHDGTSNPLCIRFAYGEGNKKELLADLFRLTTLAFTKPDDCSRFPITLKINDIKLNDAASEYDEDAYRNVQTLLEDLNISTHE